MPMVLQSDQGKEFVNDIMQELVRLMGAKQVFSMALHPQTQGIVERCHKEVRRVLRMIVESVLRARPREWPRYLFLAQAKLRQAEIAGSGVTPYSCWHGWFGSTQLQSSLLAVEQIPEEMVLEDWLRRLVVDSQEILASAGRALEASAEDRLKAREAHAHPREIEEGSLVVVERAYFERDLKRLVSNCDGPFLVERCDAYGAILLDPVTRVECFEGKRVALERCIIYNYPMMDLEKGNEQLEEIVEDFRVDDMVVYVERVKAKHVVMGKVKEVLGAEGLINIERWVVRAPENFGPLARKIWEKKEEEGLKELEASVCVKVELDEHNVITAASIERIQKAGLPAGR